MGMLERHLPSENIGFCHAYVEKYIFALSDDDHIAASAIEMRNITQMSSMYRTLLTRDDPFRFVFEQFSV
jgi:hypothetical protein